MTIPITYKSESNIWNHFVSHARLGLTKQIQDHQVNFLEHLGNSVLWIAEDLPHIVWEKIKQPRIVTIALTALALFANSTLFYPIKTWLAIKTAIRVLPFPPFWTVRLTSYIYSSFLIVGYGLRAFGRFSNPELMSHFCHPLFVKA